jgi:hypothetical protein
MYTYVTLFNINISRHSLSYTHFAKQKDIQKVQCRSGENRKEKAAVTTLYVQAHATHFRSIVSVKRFEKNQCPEETHPDLASTPPLGNFPFINPMSIAVLPPRIGRPDGTSS